MEGEGVEHPDRGPLGRRRQGPRRTERCALQTPRPGLILAASGAGGTLRGTTPLLWQTPPRTNELSRTLVCTAAWFSKPQTDEAGAASPTRKWIVESHPAANKVINVGRHHREVVQQCNGRNLLVDGVVGIRHPISVLLEHLSQPLFKQQGLGVIAPMADELNSTAQFTDGYGGQKDGAVVAN